MNKRWVKLKQNNATQVSTEGCENIDDFLEGLQEEVVLKAWLIRC
jgi:hypothetical protein